MGKNFRFSLKSILLLFILIGVAYRTSKAQDCITKSIKVEYDNGIEVFMVCKTNPSIVFEDDKKYFWYTEFTGLKSTEGGCGGMLLNGDYKFFDNNGGLLVDAGYKNGLKDGLATEWDSAGKIISKYIYEDGEIVYLKRKTKDGYWIENIGKLFKKGMVKKVFSPRGNVIEETVILSEPDLETHTIRYFDNPKKLIEQTYNSYYVTPVDAFFGEFKQYYENGQLAIRGNYLHNNDILSNLQDGEWIWYNEDGIIDTKIKYRAEVSYYPNKNVKEYGNWLYDEENQEWIKNGQWTINDERGNLKEIIEYDMGQEIKRMEIPSGKN